MEKFSKNTLFLKSLSEKAGEIILKYYVPGGQSSDFKADNSHVTKADLEVNSVVIEEVKKNYPDFGILAEEESSNEDRDKLFVVDPLDGTRMFVAGAPLFCFSAAIVIDGKSEAGVLFNPMAKRTLLAEKNKGAYLVETGKKISVSDKNTFDGAIINDGWNWTSSSEVFHKGGAKTPQLYTVTEVASLIATGGFDGEIFFGRMAHDVAAAKVIVEEAGGRVTDVFGEEQRYDRKIRGAIISNGKLHDLLVKTAKGVGLTEEFRKQYPDSVAK